MSGKVERIQPGQRTTQKDGLGGRTGNDDGVGSQRVGSDDPGERTVSNGGRSDHREDPGFR